MTKKPSPLPSGALYRFWWAREKINIQPAVNRLVQMNVNRAQAEDHVRSLIQLIVSHALNSEPTRPYVMLKGPVNDLYESLRRDDCGLLSGLTTILKLNWGHMTLDGIATAKVEASDGIEYTLRCLQNDYNSYLTPSLTEWLYSRTRHDYTPTALVWFKGGDQALRETMRLGEARKISNCWATAV